ncbi:MAG: trypsin [Myxococcales bacterium]|nr:trypsin [Myxococcales bacterium]
MELKLKSLMIFKLLFTVGLMVTARAGTPQTSLHQPFAPVDMGGEFTTTSKNAEDKTLAPYFYIPGGDPELDTMPLKRTDVDVNITGVIADVQITQVYKNEGKKNIEALYVFPASTRAAVYAMKMTLDERTIEAQIQKRDEARKNYEAAKANGQTASLLEQQRPNVFQMNVGNILPGDEIKVELKYTELLVPEEQIYEFVFPTVVGPRYSETPVLNAPAHEQWVANPYLKQGTPAPKNLNIEVRVNTGIPIDQMGCASHDVNIDYDGANEAYVQLNTEANKDFILKYKLAGKQIETGLLLYEGEEENIFVAMVEPPKRVKPKHTLNREYIFVVDVSGSMNGFPLNISKSIMTNIIQGLKPQDQFNVLLFAGGSQILSQDQSLKATARNKSNAIAWINGARGGGGTRITPALRRAMNLPKSEGTSRSVVVLTDGYISVETQTYDLIREKLGDANLFAFGIGKSVNRHLIEGMARVGHGEPFVVTEPAQGPSAAARFANYVFNPVMKNIEARFENVKVDWVTPQKLPDLFARKPIVLMGKYKKQRGLFAQPGKLILEGETVNGSYHQEIDFDAVQASEKNKGLAQLWARQQIRELADYNSLRNKPELVERITQLGLDYHLMTAYTSFVAIDSEKRTDQTGQLVKQPLALPEGVSNLAVGMSGVGAASAKSIQRKVRRGHGYRGGLGAPAYESADTALKVVPPRTPPKRALKGSVSMKTIKLTGAAEGVWVSQGLARQLRMIKNQYNRMLKLSGSHTGSIAVRLVLNAKGDVLEVFIHKDTLNDARFQRRLKALLKKAKFQVPSAKGVVKLKLRFDFQLNQ